MSGVNPPFLQTLKIRAEIEGVAKSGSTFEGLKNPPHFEGGWKSESQSRGLPEAPQGRLPKTGSRASRALRVTGTAVRGRLSAYRTLLLSVNSFHIAGRRPNVHRIQPLGTRPHFERQSGGDVFLAFFVGLAPVSGLTTVAS